MLCPACISPLKSRLTYLAASLVFPLRCLINILNLTSPKGNPWSPPLFLFYHSPSAQAKTLKSSLTTLSLPPQIWSGNLTFNLCPECNHFSLFPLLPCYLSPQLAQEPPRWEPVAFCGGTEIISSHGKEAPDQVVHLCGCPPLFHSISSVK